MSETGSQSNNNSGCPVDHTAMTLHGDESRLDPVILKNPFPFYQALREEKPVFYDAQLDVYLVSKYDDVMKILRDPVTFSLEHGYQDRWATGFVDELEEIMNREGGGFIRDIIAVDPPVHTRLRSLIEKAFTAHRVKSLEPRFSQIIGDVIEPLAERGYADGINEIGVPITARIICEQLGFNWDEVGTEKIKRWTQALLAQMGRMQTHDEFLENAKGICEMQNYIIPIIHAREENPQEDMISDLVHAQIDDDENPSLSFEEKVSCVRAMLIAGNDTTAAAIANVMYILATQPELAEQLSESIDDDKLMTRFVEEVLRLRPPVHGLYRTAMEDVEIDGTKIPAFSQICILFASANEDEDHFSCPRDIDINRQNVMSHLTFGAGIHRCIGAALSRMEIKVATREIVKRLANIKLAIDESEISYLQTLATHTFESLPLTFTKRA